MTLWQDFLTNSNKPVLKWPLFFPAYERHFAPWQGRSVTFLEIGVSRGGSLQMWQRYFGPKSRIIGIDIEPECKAHESQGIAVRIGDQSDPAFLSELVEEFGVPDVILDDGSHRMDHIQATFDFFYPKMHKNAVYMVEDLHTAYWEEYGGGLDKADTFIAFSKGCVDRMNAHHTRGALAADHIGKHTACISFYDSIVCFEKGDVWWTNMVETGVGRSGNHDL